MSKIAKAPVELPAGVTATIAADAVTIKGAKGSLSFPLTAGVSVVQTDKKLQIRFDAEGLARSEEHTSELQSRLHLVCRLLLEKKKKQYYMAPRSQTAHYIRIATGSARTAAEGYSIAFLRPVGRATRSASPLLDTDATSLVQL